MKLRMKGEFDMNTARGYETTYTPLHRVETLDFQKARERARKLKRKQRWQRLLGVAIIALGVITIPLCGDITPCIFTTMFGVSAIIP